jgi:hypothetical protein
MKRDAVIVFACAATLCGSAQLRGQNPVDVPDQPGIWKATTYENRSPGAPIGTPRASAAELAALRTALTRLEQVVHDTPMLTAPRGFDVHARQRLDRGCPGNPVLCRQAPLPGWIDFDFEPYYRRPDGKVMTMKVPPDVEVAFNDPAAAYVGHHAGSDLTDVSGNMIVGPLIEAERAGTVAILDTGVVILGRNPRPFFVPASREQYLRALVARAVSRSQPVEEFRDELAALSSEQRRTPAYIDGTGRLVAASHEKAPPLFQFNSDDLAALSPEQRRATPLFIFNPDYFDPALPRTALQLITVRFLGARDTNLEGIRLRLYDRPDLLERSPLTPERLAYLASTGLDVTSYRVFELTRLLNYSALTALLAAPAPPAR